MCVDAWMIEPLWEAISQSHETWVSIGLAIFGTKKVKVLTQSYWKQQRKIHNENLTMTAVEILF